MSHYLAPQLPGPARQRRPASAGPPACARARALSRLPAPARKKKVKKCRTLPADLWALKPVPLKHNRLYSLFVWSTVGKELPKAQLVETASIANSEVCVDPLAHLSIQIGKVDP